jgi:hypothetical protein
MSEFAPYRMYVECHVECRAYFTVGINKPVSITGKHNECRKSIPFEMKPLLEFECLVC